MNSRNIGLQINRKLLLLFFWKHKFRIQVQNMKFINNSINKKRTA